MKEPLVHVIVGPERHGVVRFGVELDTALRAGGFDTVQRRVIESDTVSPGRGAHLQFTDRLFGADAQQAVTAVRKLAANVHRGGGRVTATLHDLPQRFDRANYATRAAAYASVSAVLDWLVVSSAHERRMLRDIGIRQPAAVIPLPIAAPAPGSAAPSHASSVAVFGFIYPDKGHAEVLEAMRGLPPAIRMMAVGEPSAGHDDMVDQLERIARAQDRSFVVTGHVPDDRVVPLLQSATVPVVHHRHVSASGSLNSWISAGRRPLVSATRYVREIDHRNPGALWLFDDDQRSLAEAIRAALDEPSSTWLSPDLVCSPTPDQAADSYGRLLRSVHR